MSAQRRLMATASIISVVINVALVSMSFIGSSLGSGSWISRVADAIAAPPGVIAERAFEPRDHSTGALVAAAAESLACSIAFYGIVALVVLEAVHFGRATHHPNSE
jgi:hypothetical protein